MNAITIYTLLITFILFVFSGCDGSSDHSTSSPILNHIDIQIDSHSLVEGSNGHATAAGYYSNGTKNTAQPVNWQSSNLGVATIDSSGEITAITKGTTKITATSGKITSIEITLTVTAKLQAIQVSPLLATLPIRDTQQYTALGINSDGTHAVLKGTPIWKSLNPSVATISPTGIASTLAIGHADITATLGKLLTTQPAVLNVTKTALVAIVLSINSGDTLAKGKTLQLKATGIHTNGAYDITSQVTWVSTKPSFASINTTSLLTAHAIGKTNITAALGSISSLTTGFAVTAAELKSIAVTAQKSSLAKGESQTYTATGTYTDKSTSTLTAPINWISSDDQKAIMDQNGLVTTLGTGPVDITAEKDGITSTPEVLTINNPVFTGIQISPNTLSTPAGLTQQFTAFGMQSDGTTAALAGTTHWNSSQPQFATINPTTGLATAVAAGQTDITASNAGLKTIAPAIFNVTQQTLLDIELVLKPNQTLPMGEALTIKATGIYTNGAQDITSKVTWSTTPTGVLSISNGQLTTITTGNTRISASLNGINSQPHPFKVVAPVLTSIIVSATKPALNKGETQSYSATVTYSDKSTALLGSPIHWASSDDQKAIMDQNGLVTTLGTGRVGITAEKDGITSTPEALTINNPVLTGIQISPNTLSTPAGLTQQFTAFGMQSDGTTAALTGAANWNSSQPQFATINSTTGLATAVAAGKTNISATHGLLTSTTPAIFNVTQQTLLDIELDLKPNQTLPMGEALTIKATGIYTNGAQDITSNVTWSTTPTGVLSISNGQLTTITTGKTRISASLSGINSQTHLFEVVAPVLTSIIVSAAKTSLNKGETQSYSATVTYSDKSTALLGSPIHWASSNDQKAIMDQNGLVTTLSMGSVDITAEKDGVTSANSPLSITAAVFSAIKISPNPASVPLGNTQQFQAQGIKTDGTKGALASTPTWDSSDKTVATISAAGLVSTLTIGNSNITATLAGLPASPPAIFNVTQEELLSIALNIQTNDTLAIGETLQLKATGTYTNGSKDITTKVTWASTSPTVALFSTAGLVEAKSVGKTQITAIWGNISNPATTLVITAAKLTSIGVTATQATLAKGESQTYTATGAYTDGSTTKLTAPINWISSDNQKAIMDQNGRVTTLGMGSVDITAEKDGVTSANSPLSITAAVFSEIEISPNPASVPLGNTQQFQAQGIKTDGTKGALASTPTWDSSDKTVATISAAGLVSTLTIGNSNITATLAGLPASPPAIFNVTQEELLSIALNIQTNDTLAIGETLQLKATGTYTNGPKDITTKVTWASTSPTVASINPMKLVEAKSVGKTQITATLGSISNPATSLSVTAAKLTSIRVTAPQATLAKGESQAYTATGTYTDGSTTKLTAPINWISSDNQKAIMDQNGRVTTLGTGRVDITAEKDGVTSANSPLNITAAVFSAIKISPNPASVPLGNTQQFQAQGIKTDGTKGVLARTPTWDSSDKTVATISAAGLVSTLTIGNSNITATLAGLPASPPAIFNVTQEELLSIALNIQTNDTLAIGETLQLKATGTYTNGPKDITTKVTWASTSPTVASINPMKLVEAKSVGKTQITATLGSISNPATSLSVTAAKLTSIRVTAPQATLAKGESQAYTATGTYTDGSTTKLTAPINWISSDNQKAIMDQNGRVTTLGTGRVDITAEKDGVTSANSPLNITAAVFSAIKISPNPASVPLGNTQQFQAQGIKTDGTKGALASTPTWDSSDKTVATISAAGLVSTLTIGNSNITATLAGLPASPPAIFNVTQQTLLDIELDLKPNQTLPMGEALTIKATGIYTNGAQDITSKVTWSTTPTGVLSISNGQITTITTGNTRISASLNGINSLPNPFKVIAPVLTSIIISATKSTLNKGETQSYSATGTYSDKSTALLGSPIHWASSDDQKAIMDQNSLVTTLGTGPVDITAEKDGITSTPEVLTINNPVFTGIQVSPNTLSTPAGLTQQFTAFGMQSDGTTAALAGTTHWNSSQPQFATINPTTGLAMAIAAGQTDITASNAGLKTTTPATFNVTQQALLDIELDLKPNQTLPMGEALTIKATGIYTNGAQDITSKVTWSTTPTGVLSVSNGQLTTITTGNTRISASLNGINSQPHPFKVVAPVLTSIIISPTKPALNKGETQSYSATVTYSDKSTALLGSPINWISSDNQKAIMDQNGRVTTLGTGRVDITAEKDGVTSANSPLSITAAVFSEIEISPNPASVPLGNTQQFQAQGIKTDGTKGALASTPTWDSSDKTVATISAAGLVSTLTIGNSNITATLAGLPASPPAIFNVTQEELLSIALNIQTNDTLAIGETLQLKATGTYTNGSKDITTKVTWASTSPTVASINPMKLVEAKSVGKTQITATLGSISNPATSLSVTAAKLTSIRVTATQATLAKGESQAYTATGAYTDGSTTKLTAPINWISSDNQKAIMDQNGRVTTLGTGPVDITAEKDGVTSANSPLSITAAVFSEIEISPNPASVPLGNTQQFQAQGIKTDGTKGALASTPTWDSSDKTVATISAAGLVSTLTIGNSNITATLAGLPASPPAIFNVTQEELLSIALNIQTNDTLAMGKTLQLKATGIYSNGQKDITAKINWTMSMPPHVAISPAGLLSTTSVGTTSINAMVGLVLSPAINFEVTPAELTEIKISAAKTTLIEGETQSYTATGTYTDGQRSNPTNVQWNSSNQQFATVNNQGKVTAQLKGSTDITASTSKVTSNIERLTVYPAITDIQIQPAALSLAKGKSQQLTAQAVKSDQSFTDVTTQVTWDSTNKSAATVNAGLVTALAIGATNITAKLNNVSANQPSSVNVTKKEPTRITLRLTKNNFPVGITPYFRVWGAYPSQGSSDISKEATMTTSNRQVADFDENNQLITLSPGSTQITAVLGSTVSAPVTVTVTSAKLTRMIFSPYPLSDRRLMNIYVNQPVPLLSPILTYDDGTIWESIYGIFWTNPKPSVVRVDGNGNVTGLIPGNVYLKAEKDGLTTSDTLLINSL